MSRWLVLLLVLCASATGLAACGGDDGGDDVGSILAETFGGKGTDVKSGRLDLAFRLDAKGLQNVNGPIGLHVSGPFASTGSGQLPKFDFTAALDLGGQQLSAGAVSTGDKGFVRFQDQAYAVSDQLFEQFKKGYAEQSKCSENKKGVGFAALGIDPSQWLVGAKKAGEEKVGGADTTHITGRIDVPKFLADVNRILARSDLQQADPCAKDTANKPSKTAGRQLSDSEIKAITDAVKDARVDVWTGKDDRALRRMNIAIRFVVPEDQREQAGGLESGTLRFDLTIGALNEEQDIEAPKNAKPLDDLVGQLGGQVPGLSSGGNGASSTGSGSTSKYQDCVNQAGQDIKKLQECSALIGQ